MKKQILVDTDVIVDFLRGYTKAISYVKNHSAEIVLSSIVVAELYAGVRDDERARLDDFVTLFPILPVTTEIANRELHRYLPARFFLLPRPGRSRDCGRYHATFCRCAHLSGF